MNATKIALLLFALPATVAVAESECFCLQDINDKGKYRKTRYQMAEIFIKK